VLILLELAAASVLGYLAYRLTGPTPLPGLRSGLFLILGSLLLVLLLTRLVSIWIEYFVYDSPVLPETWGIGLTGALGIGLVVLLFRFFFYKPGWQQKLIGFEEQGWFSVRSYKRSQGQRVRRGTIVGLLALAGSGVFILVNHRTLETGSKDWVLDVPFTGRVTMTNVGDAVKAANNFKANDDKANMGLRDLASLFEVHEATESEKPFTIDLKTFRAANEELKNNWVKVDRPKESDFAEGELVEKTKLEQEKSRIRNGLNPKLDENARQREEQDKLPTSMSAELAQGSVHYRALTLLPDVAYTVPLLLAGLALWIAWRVVNLPPFADFLIATEAELNKVSWTTRKRLIQDTVVVLSTVLLLTLFLLIVDLAWFYVLSWKPIGVLKADQQTKEEHHKGDW
jgi:preprotein translocase SecE subunit